LPLTSASLPLSETSLGDVTDYNYASYAADYLDEGWFIKLAVSEKVVSRPMTFGGMVFFTTYLPDCGAAASTDQCQGSGIGSGRLYILDHQTGRAVFNFDPSNDSDVNGDGVIAPDERLLAGDRYVTVAGLPTAPVLIMTKQGPQILTGTTEGIFKVDLPANLSVNRYYWQQL
jgi:type IV pilus assembly protein PilY1